MAASAESTADVFDVAIVGAGLSGLRTADLLAAKGLSVVVLGVVCFANCRDNRPIRSCA